MFCRIAPIFCPFYRSLSCPPFRSITQCRQPEIYIGSCHSVRNKSDSLPIAYSPRSCDGDWIAFGLVSIFCLLTCSFSFSPGKEEQQAFCWPKMVTHDWGNVNLIAGYSYVSVHINICTCQQKTAAFGDSICKSLFHQHPFANCRNRNDVPSNRYDWLMTVLSLLVWKIEKYRVSETMVQIRSELICAARILYALTGAELCSVFLWFKTNFIGRNKKIFLLLTVIQ